MNIQAIGNVVIYPFDFEFMPIIRYVQEIRNKVKGIYAPKAWGYNGKDASIIDEREIVGMIVDDMSSISYEDVDLVINNTGNKLADQSIIKCIEKFLSKGKHVYCLKSIEDKNIKRFETYKKFHYFRCSEYFDRIETQNYQISTPTVCISGIMPDINKFDVFLSVSKRLESKGLKLSYIVGKEYAQFLGMHRIPQYIIDEKYRLRDNINIFRNYISYIELVEKPDILIVELPGGILPYDKNIDNYFGALHMVAYSAIRFNYNILCLPLDYYDKKNFDTMRNIFKYRFGNEISNFVISNKYYDAETYEFESRVEMTPLKYESIVRKKYDEFWGTENEVGFLTDDYSKIISDKIIERVIDSGKMYLHS